MKHRENDHLNDQTDDRQSEPAADSLDDEGSVDKLFGNTLKRDHQEHQDQTVEVNLTSETLP